MRKKIFGLLAVPLLILVANAALGLAAVCSDALLPEAESPATSQQLVWSNYDYWYSAIYVVRDSRMEETAPGPGVHSAPGRAERDYLLAGYPATWGMDSFLDLECPPAEDTPLDSTPPDAASQVSLATTSGLRSLPACNPAATGCSRDASPLAARHGAGDGDEVAGSAALDRQPARWVVISGMIQTAGDGVLVLRTDTGRYVPMLLPSAVPITRRTDVNLAVIVPDDVVGAVLGYGERGEKEVLEFRVYRGTVKDNVAYSHLSEEAEAAAPAGLELRGLVRNVERTQEVRTIRLRYAEREGSLRVSRNVPVALIEAADFSELQPISGGASVLATQEEGALVVRSIEILDSARTRQ